MKAKIKRPMLWAGTNAVFLIALSGIFSYSCKKLTLNDALPVVAVKSVSVISADSAAVTGTIINPGADVIEYEGLCYSSDPMPQMLDNQYFVGNSSTNFTIHVPFKQDSTYYVRVYATNSYGYGISSPYKFTVAHAKPALAPCPLSNMKLVDQGNPYPIDFVYSGTGYASYGVWGLEVDYNSGNNALRMDFNKVPTNGAYVVQGDAGQFSSDNNPKEVYAELDVFNTYNMQSGDSVYVSENADKSISFSFCHLHYIMGSASISMAGQFTAK